MSATLKGKTDTTGVDAQGNPVDLSDFEDSYYKPGEVEATLEDYFESFESITEGQIVKGKILKITDKEVFIDVNFKSEGVIPIHEFKSIEEYKTGDEIEVFLEQIEDSEGNIILSKSRADFLKVWDKIHEAYENEEIVKGKLLRRIKGGVVVDLFGVDAFLPGSQIDLRQIPDMDAIIGETFEFRVIKINKIRRNIVVSRRVILEADRMEQREKILSDLKKGDVREGSVKNITDFGAFIDLGGVDGLLHITDMSWGRVNHPSEIVALGDTLNVMILDFDDNKERISLGLKQLTEHPWKDVIEKFPEGSRVRGKVVSITDYGAFMELEKGIEGLIHISEMSWTQHIKHPSKLVGIGDIVEAVVLKVDKDNHKISLGFKQLEPDPWENVYNDYPIGSVSTGKVRNIAAFGAFIELQEGVDGLVHISDMSWTKKINYPGEIIKKGDSVEVKILDIDEEKRRISLGIKQLTEDPWSNLAEQFPVGKEIECEVARILDRGIVVNLTEDVEGFIPLKELGQALKHPSDVYNIGDKTPAKVIEFDIDGRKIVVSVSEYFKGRPEEELKEYLAAHPVKKSAPKKDKRKDKKSKAKESEGETEETPVKTDETVDSTEASESAGEPEKVEIKEAVEEEAPEAEAEAVAESPDSSESVEQATAPETDDSSEKDDVSETADDDDGIKPDNEPELVEAEESTDEKEASKEVDAADAVDVAEASESAEEPESSEVADAVETEDKTEIKEEPEATVVTEAEKDVETETETEVAETPENIESTETKDSADEEKKE
jgi:small subunit ribosomal protein S1